MNYLLSVLLFALPAQATSQSPIDQLTGPEICGLLAVELNEAVKFDIISENDAIDILIRCSINYS